ncbi:MAG: PIN domain nuclease [Spirochaetaceae bacterium]|nr:MAG: PIN domain nuclease [Spirochaetaceae bacterium]
MILVDTSVLVDFLKGRENGAVSALARIIERGIPFGINDYIYQEILQGARTIEEFDLLKAYFETIPFYSLKYDRESFEKAAQLNMICRQSGVTVRSTIDLLIAQIALENDLFLLHNDNDFTNISQVVRELKIYEIS